MDLPIAHQFGLDKAFEDECRAKEEALRDAEGRTKTDAAEGTEAPASGAQAPENTATNTLAPEQPEGGDTGDTDGNAGGEASAQEDVYGDPLDWLGRAAGYGDGEAWWNHMVEERIDGLELFDAIREAMTTLRAEAPRRERGERETRRESSGAYTSKATGGHIPDSSTNGSTDSPSGGPSINRQSGCIASRARNRLRAHPGPWWRMPKSRTV